ncbi:MAG: phosphate ABC transporter permease PstA [Nitriliruptoraceae bacterium]|nr:phosphate ABC transporter permease PstA [Nitriliruptoraceae bacterium]
MSIDSPPRASFTDEHPSLKVRTPNARRRELVSKIMSWVLAGTVIAALTPLVLLLWQVIARGGPAFGWEFLTQLEPMSFRETGGGYAAGIVGTLYMTGVAAIVSIPLGICAALYLNEQPHGRYAGTVRFFTDVMTGVPSIFVGLAVYALLVSGSGGLGIGFGTAAGAAALGIIMLPIVVRTSEEMLRLVPADLKFAAVGMGARQWQTTFKVTLPAAAPGLTTGAILAVARGAGETAPLLMTALGARQIITSFTGAPQGDIGLLMLDGFRQPFAPGIERAWAGGLTLILITLSMSIIARLIARRSQV